MFFSLIIALSAACVCRQSKIGVGLKEESLFNTTVQPLVKCGRVFL